MRKMLTVYEADAGTCVINGIGIDNGVGDGCFGVLYDDNPTDQMLQKKALKRIWIDLRNNYPVVVHGYDCDKKGEEMMGQKILSAKDFPGAQALKIMPANGDIVFIKYF